MLEHRFLKELEWAKWTVLGQSEKREVPRGEAQESLIQGLL